MKKFFLTPFNSKWVIPLLMVIFIIAINLILNAQTDLPDKTLSGHTGNVESICFSPDGKVLASSSYDNTIKIWDINSWNCIKTLTGHSKSVNSVCFSTDGKYLASGSTDKTIKIWDVNSGSCIKTFSGHSNSVFSVSFSPDGKLLVSGALDNKIKLWEVESGNCIKTLSGHSNTVCSVCFSPDTKYIASGSQDKTVKLWNTTSGICIKTFSDHTFSVNSVCFSLDGIYLFSGSQDKTIKIWEINNGSCIKTLYGHTNSINSICLNNNGKYLASGSLDGSIKIWDIISGNCIKTLSENNNTFRSVCYNPNGSFLASGTGNGNIQIWGISITAKVKFYVEPKLLTWQQKGEYEKLSDYQVRVNEQSRQKKIEELTNEAIAILKQDFKEKFDFENPVIKGNYDPDNESYLIESPSIGEVVLKVPVKEAPDFKGNFEYLNYKNPDFIIKNDQFVLSKFIWSLPNGKDHYWDSNETSTYALNNISFNYAPIDNIKITENNNENIKKPTITQTNISMGGSDVDINIPVAPQKNDKTFVVIIANENYQKEVKVPYAFNDGMILKEYCMKTLGIPEKNIHIKTDATYGNMKSEINWLCQVLEAFNGEAKGIFFYAGHGMPNEKDKSAYLLPTDGSANDFESAIKLEDLYAKFGAQKTSQIVMLFDACFSGSVRDDKMLIEARGVKIKPTENKPAGNLIIFTAASGDETAYAYNDKKHGLFTYFLLKKLQESKGNCTLKELNDYISIQVKQQSIIVNNKSQTPKVIVSNNMMNLWENLLLK